MSEKVVRNICIILGVLCIILIDQNYSKVVPNDTQLLIMYIVLGILISVNFIIEKNTKRRIQISLLTLGLGFCSYRNFIALIKYNYVSYTVSQRGPTLYCIAILALLSNIIMLIYKNNTKSLKGDK